MSTPAKHQAPDPSAPRPGAPVDSNRRAAALLVWLRRALPPLLLIVTAAFAWFEVQGFDLDALRRALRRVPLWTLIGLQVLALAAVLEMVLYDWWAARWLKLRLGWDRLVRYSWLANATNNLIGLSGLAGSGIRFLVLTRDGVPARAASLYAGVIMLSVPVGLAALLPVALALGRLDLVPRALPRPALLTVLLGFAAYLPVFLGLAASRGLLHRVLSGTARIGLGGGLTLTAISVLDWLLAILVAWCCFLAVGARVDPGLFLAAFTFAAALGVLSLIPGGLGVFDTTLLVLLTRAGVSPATAAAGLLLFRLVYYLVPWLIALPLGSGLLARTGGPLGERLARAWQNNPLLGLVRLFLNLIASVGVRMLALLILATGLVLLASAALPGVEDRVERVLRVLPLPALELSHLLSVGVGVLLIALSRGIDQQVRGVYLVAMPLLLAGALLSVLKGAAAGQALFLLAVAGLLWLRRDAFYRLSYPFLSRRNLLWLLALLLSVAAFVLLGPWVDGDDYTWRELWFQSAPHLHAARYLRSLPIAVLALAGWLAWGLFRMPRPTFPPTDAAALERARTWLDTHGGGTFAHLLFMGDKHLLYAADGRCLIQYRRIRGRLIALGDPLGDPAAFGPALLEFRELADRYDLDPVFYEVAHEHLHLYHDAGFALFKAGEMGLVPAADFTLSGRRNQTLRTGVNRALRDGLTAERLDPPFDEATWAALAGVSDAWLRERGGGEKGFSLGTFDRDYLRRAPVFVVRQEGRIVAFASLTPSYGERAELGVDLMRQLPDAPTGTMDFLFTRMIECAREEGYTWFNLGMAPLSGVGKSRWARADERLARFAYDSGSRLYNYKGVRSFKEKFHPVWQSRYIAYPLYRPLPTLLVDIAALVAGGYRQILGK